MPKFGWRAGAARAKAAEVAGHDVRDGPGGSSDSCQGENAGKGGDHVSEMHLSGDEQWLFVEGEEEQYLGETRASSIGL